MAPDTNKDDTSQPKEAVKIAVTSHDDTDHSGSDTVKDDLGKLDESVHPAAKSSEMLGHTSTSDPVKAKEDEAPVPPSSANVNPAAAAASAMQPVGTASSMGGGIVSGSNTSGPVTFDPTKKRRFGKRAVFASALSVALVVALGAGYVFGFYIPNKPENVWAAAMSNSGKVYDALTEYATKDKDVKAVQIDGSYKLNGAVTSDGSFSGSGNQKEGQLTGSFSAGGLKLGLDVRALQSTGDMPDLYFKLTGLQGLGGLLGSSNPGAAQVVNSLNNQWFVVDHSLLAQANASASKTKFTKKDVQEFLKAVGVPTKDRLFSNDSSKAVLVVKSLVGAEKKDGRNTYHYKVGYDAKHLAAYAEALCNSVRSTKIGEILFKSQAESSCNDVSKVDIPSSDKTADVWVDKRTKLIHVVRVSEESSYVEMSQDYQGGDEMPFGLKVHSDGTSATDVTMTGTLNTAKNTFDLSATFSASIGLSGDKQTGEFTLSVKPSDKNDLQIDKPKNARNLLELLNSLGLGGLVSSGSSGTNSDLLGAQSKAKDTERRTDLAMLDASMNEYMANNNGQLPTLAQLNDAAWLKQHMPSLDKEALRDPDGSSYKLSATPKTKTYALVSSCTTACRQFSLVAILSDGQQYKLDN